MGEFSISLKTVQRVQVTVLIIVGGALQVIFFVVAYLQFVASGLNQFTFLPFPSYKTDYLLAYFFFTIVYCWITTSLLKPKKLVMPLYVQYCTFILSAGVLFYFYMKSSNPSPATPQFILDYSFTLGLAFGVITIVGSIQSGIVRVLAGLNLENIYQETYSVRANFPTCRQTLINESFLKNYGFEIKEDDNNRIILYKRSTEDDVLIVGLERDEAYRADCVLCVSYYNQGYSSVSTKEVAKDFLLSFLNDFTTRIRDKTGLEPLGKKGIVAPISKVVSAYAHTPIRNKLGDIRDFWKHTPIYFKITMPLTLLIYLFVIINTFFQSFFPTYVGISIPQTDFLTASLLVFLAIASEFGLALREELTQKIAGKMRER